VGRLRPGACTAASTSKCQRQSSGAQVDLSGGCGRSAGRCCQECWKSRDFREERRPEPSKRNAAVPMSPPTDRHVPQAADKYRLLRQLDGCPSSPMDVPPVTPRWMSLQSSLLWMSLQSVIPMDVPPVTPVSSSHCRGLGGAAWELGSIRATRVSVFTKAGAGPACRARNANSSTFRSRDARLCST
jgi:hypothetical protein